jgi:hypothetical protein
VRKQTSSLRKVFQVGEKKKKIRIQALEGDNPCCVRVSKEVMVVQSQGRMTGDKMKGHEGSKRPLEDKGRFF